MIRRLKHIFLHRGGGWILLPAWLFLNTLASVLSFQIDLTADKRYTLSPATQKLVRSLQEPVTIDVFLEGEFPAGFRKLASSTRDFLDLLKKENGSNIQFRFVSPDDLQENNQPFSDTLAKLGAMPINLTVQKKAGQSTNLLYPYAWICSGDRQQLIPLFGGSKGRISQEEINGAETLLEYQFTTTIQKLTTSGRATIAYEVGHGQPTDLRGYDLENTLKAEYRFGLLNLRDSLSVPEGIDVLMIVKPTEAFSEADKIKLDQFVMRGGKLLLFIDNLIAEQDSLLAKQTGETIAYDRKLELTDLLFRYGCRINTDLIMDLQSDFIPLVVGGTPENPQLEYLRWNYFPLLNGAGPFAKSLGYVSSRFANSIDTIDVSGVTKTPILVSSTHSRIIPTPVMIRFEENRNAPEDEKFNLFNIPIGYLLEGTFTSLFSNRISSGWRDSLQRAGKPFQSKSVPTRMIVVSDGDLVLNEVSNQTGPLPMGWNKYTFTAYQEGQAGGQYFIAAANRDFLKMTLEQLVGDPAILATRNKEIVLRLLDARKIEASRSQWQLLNLVVPLVVLALFGVGLYGWRRRRYGR
ncbi:MAG: gliding motility-associated ABC transporter substrate-binding protein GldG [Bacteroidetes bacterium]|nr:gliding motility-associated ABC transporter substrate-binding protein GldG [Bacteroidota bacterium]